MLYDNETFVHRYQHANLTTVEVSDVMDSDLFILKHV